MWWLTKLKALLLTKIDFSTLLATLTPAFARLGTIFRRLTPAYFTIAMTAIGVGGLSLTPFYWCLLYWGVAAISLWFYWVLLSSFFNCDFADAVAFSFFSGVSAIAYFLLIFSLASWLGQSFESLKEGNPILVLALCAPLLALVKFSAKLWFSNTTANVFGEHPEHYTEFTPTPAGHFVSKGMLDDVWLIGIILIIPLVIYGVACSEIYDTYVRP